ncbi:MAG: SDR family NAD(P)-dependent oxidoreductase, partial [Deltaproteobacteria bacterium]|nr:SDR family NAD(P)-dependent oxidoreductase [Deltaproteobacteria bacterium]
CMDSGFNSLLFLSQAIGERLPADPIQIKVISDHLQDVTGEEVLFPEKATILGPCRVVPQEYPHIQCTSVDITTPNGNAHRKKELNNLLIEELFSETDDSIVAYRGKYRWVQTFEPLLLKKTEELNLNIRERGVYLITGGLGGIGLVLAEYLAQTSKVNLTLVARSRLPERYEWEEWLKSHGNQDETSRKIRKIQAIEKLRSDVMIVSADVTDLAQMESAVSQTLDRFGQINGVIHAAGIAGGGVIQIKTSKMAEDILAPKVKGTMVLDKLFKDVKLDYFVLCSSITSLLGEIGQVDYCAANAFLDAYAQSCQSEKNVISINWYTWQEVGMAVNTEVPLDLKKERQTSLKLGILPDEGKEAFNRILANPRSQVVVSTQNFKALVKESKKTPMLDSAEKIKEASLPSAAHERPDLSSAYVVPGNLTEQTIAKIWQELLKIDKVGIHDNFFELGGHSLLATRALSRLKSKFPFEFTMSDLFERPTIHSLSEMILEINEGSPSFVDSRNRGQKRKERRMQRIRPRKRRKLSEGFESI